MTDSPIVQCPKCGMWFTGPVAHHNHYVEHYRTKKGQEFLDHLSCGDPGPIAWTTKDGIRVHGRRDTP